MIRPSTAWRRILLAALLTCLGAAAPAAAQRGRDNQRVEDLETAARRDSCDAQAHYRLAMAYVGRHRFDSADTALARAVALDPQAADAVFALGLVQNHNDHYWEQLRRRGGDTAVVREHLRRSSLVTRALLINPFLDMRMLGVTSRGGGPLALEALLNGDSFFAYQIANSALGDFTARSGGRDSVPPLLLWIHAMSAARVSREREAMADLEALVRVSTAFEHNDSLHTVPLRTNEFRYILAALHQRVAENTLAIRLYEQVLENDIGNYMAHVELARISEAEHDWFNALRERRLAVDVNPEDFSLVYDLGATLANADHWREAEEALLRTRAMAGCYPQVDFALGIAQQKLGKTEQARASLTRFLAIAPQRLSAQVDDARRRLSQLP